MKVMEEKSEYLKIFNEETFADDNVWGVFIAPLPLQLPKKENRS